MSEPIVYRDEILEKLSSFEAHFNQANLLTGSSMDQMELRVRQLEDDLETLKTQHNGLINYLQNWVECGNLSMKNIKTALGLESEPVQTVQTVRTVKKVKKNKKKSKTQS